MILRYQPPTDSNVVLAEFNAFLDAEGVVYFSAEEVIPLDRVTVLPEHKYEEAALILGMDSLPPTEKQRDSYAVALVPPPQGIWDRIIPTLRIADQLRYDTGAPCGLNSCWRDPLYNLAVGGTAGSQHKEFTAADITSTTLKPPQVAEWMEEYPEAGVMGIGRYRTFTHFDTRGYPARWGKDS